MAPEAHGELLYDMEKADVWNLGVVFVRLWLGMYPWEPESVLGPLWDDRCWVPDVFDGKERRPDTLREL
ncbi:hypothetical protein K504DRAFT_464008 [Pleomassaria siparia CBS 279.74]|uniref:Protein kinase domain-containing protein n=1 Tax=Pleomassaria siparia CBS 279.74 TaxID=1314801 RepID=A0A6G1JQP3_9PLEO|nr:hypothetical protein K504DRAFT_464008 [Pleomassaria siparia CBS 279.74]